VLLLGHPDTELVSERTPVSASMSGNGEPIATVDHDVALGVTDQEERYRHLGTADPSLHDVEAQHRRRGSRSLAHT
jgi:hypothetical protein